ncbi:MAG: hypothetical protein ACM3ML_13670 [Micromonosporaceae bacterium]
MHEFSGGNPFYLEALARMGRSPEPAADRAGHGELPPAVRAALQVEVGGTSPAALVVAQGAAVAADEFDPALAAVAAEVSEDVALEALNEMAARDIVRPTSPAGRFRFRYPSCAGPSTTRRRRAGGSRRTRGSPLTWPGSARPPRSGRITWRVRQPSVTGRRSPRCVRRPVRRPHMRRPLRHTGFRWHRG